MNTFSFAELNDLFLYCIHVTFYSFHSVKSKVAPWIAKHVEVGLLISIENEISGHKFHVYVWFTTDETVSENSNVWYTL